MTLSRNQAGSAVVQSIFAIVFLMILVLGVVQVGFSLYARNAIAAATHEGARRGLELGASTEQARSVAAQTIRDSVGGLVDDLRVAGEMQVAGNRTVVYLRATGVVRPVGPVPVPVTVDVRASASKETRS